MEARAFAIADNRPTELSSWNEALLGEQLKQLSELDLSFDLEVTGFTISEIDLRIEGLESAVASPAEVLALEVGPAVSKPGDVRVLGKHRICCGDARDEGVYASLLGNERAAVVFTDPPYNVPIEGHII